MIKIAREPLEFLENVKIIRERSKLLENDQNR